MTKKERLVLGMVLVFVGLMSVFVPAVNAGTQDWYLCAVDTRLNKTAPATTDYSFTGWSEWVAEPAQSNLTIGAGTWELYLEYQLQSNGEGILDVEVWNATGIVAYSHNNYIGSTGYGVIPIPMYNGINADFKKGESLMLKMNWSSIFRDPPVSLDVQCGNGKTKLSSPSTDPGYPIPELNTLVLSSIGLLALAGYVVYRRRNI